METRQEDTGKSLWIIDIALVDNPGAGDINYQCLYSGTFKGAENAGIAKAIQLYKHHFGSDHSDGVIENGIKIEVFEFVDVEQLDFSENDFLMLVNDLAYLIDGSFGALLGL